MSKKYFALLMGCAFMMAHAFECNAARIGSAGTSQESDTSAKKTTIKITTSKGAPR